MNGRNAQKTFMACDKSAKCYPGHVVQIQKCPCGALAGYLSKVCWNPHPDGCIDMPSGHRVCLKTQSTKEIRHICRHAWSTYVFSQISHRKDRLRRFLRADPVYLKKVMHLQKTHDRSGSSVRAHSSFHLRKIVFLITAQTSCSRCGMCRLSNQPSQ